MRDKLLLTDRGTPIVGFADWAEQLIAESTGKEGTGLLPVVVGSEGASEEVAAAADSTLVALTAEDADPAETEPVPSQVNVAGSLGAQLLLWEAATAVAGRLLGINPFDQPDVESAKTAARALMESPTDSTEPPLGSDGAVEIRTVGDALSVDAEQANSLDAAVQALVATLDPERGYLAVMVYLDRLAHADLAPIRAALEARTGRPVTFGWGPRFLHSTGQFHKGGPRVGSYLQVTGDPVQDLPVPGTDYTLGTLIAAQAAGDARVLADAGRPVLQLHLTDQATGLDQLTGVLGRR